MTLAEYLKKQRNKRGLTQNELAQKLSVHSVTLSNIERGYRASRKTLWSIAAEFQIGISALADMNKQQKGYKDESNK